jgi:arginine deiminase
MSIHVDSEIGRLRRVLIHRPGDEIVRMTQHDLSRMLFDDILSPTETQREHDVMVDIMRAAGAEVLAFDALLRSAIEAAPVPELESLVEAACERAGAAGIWKELSSWPAPRMAHALIAGAYWDEFVSSGTSLVRLRDELDGPRPMALRPVPNLMFMRDPCVALYDRVLVGRMATGARAREPLLVAFALRWAPSAAAPLEFAEDDVARDAAFRSLEGGDVLVLSPRTLMIGCSERTTPQTIERLASEALFADHSELTSIYVVMMPHMRSVMHLDTILTQIDRRLFLGHAPLIAGAGSRPPLSVFQLERDRAPKHLNSATVLDVLRQEFGADVTLVPCGGNDPLFQEREQWTDGANAVAIAPGCILLYARNTHTISTLADHGFVQSMLSVVVPREQRDAIVQEGLKRARTVFTFTGSELSRARGGGRCLTMPLERESVRS